MFNLLNEAIDSRFPTRKRTVDDTENLDLIMQMYNLLEYSKNDSSITANLWFYSKDESNTLNDDI